MSYLYLRRVCLAVASLLLPLAAFAQSTAVPPDADPFIEPLFPNLDQVRYRDAAHAYDDAEVLMLSKRHTAVLTSRMVPVTQHEQIHLQAYLHYTKSGIRTWQKIGAGAAGLAIGSLPYLLDQKSGEGNSSSSTLQKAAPFAGAAVASLPFLLEKNQRRRGPRVPRRNLDRNGMFVPNAYVRYTLYDQDRRIIRSDYETISREAKESWQEVDLTIDVPADGYLSVELGNQSKRPVWIDGLQYETRQRHIKYTDSKGINLMVSVPIGIRSIDVKKVAAFTPAMANNGKTSSDRCGGFECYQICVGPNNEYCKTECGFVSRPCTDDPPPPPGIGNPGESGPGSSISNLNTSSLSSTQVESLENTLEIMEENCFYKSMLEGLETKPEVQMNEDIPSPGGYNAFFNEIYFRSNDDIN